MSSTKPDFDALMVDWLYGELGPAEAESFEKHLATHPEAKAEADALQRTRAAFQDIGEAEPSHSLSAILMHEAAQAVAPKETLWSRFAALFQPMVLHPAASAMATLVLLCGVAGALYLKDGTRVAEPSASSQASAPRAEVGSLQAARDPSPEAPVPAPEPAEFDGDEYGAGREGEGGTGYAVGLANEERQQAIEVAQQAGARDRAYEKSPAEASPARITDSKLRESKRSQDQSAGPKGALADNLDEALSRPEAKPSTGSQTLSKSKSVRGDLNAAPTDKDDTKKAEKLPPWEQTQNQNLQLAAQSKRCKEVGRIANDILDKNTAFYKQEVESSKGAEDCRYFIASETQRRAKSRAKQAAAGAKSKQGSSVPPKALASPRKAADLESADAL